MNKRNIYTYEQLTFHISQLNSLKEKQEIDLKDNFKKVYQSFQPKNILKETVKDLANDVEFRENSFKAADGLATDFIVGRLFNKNNSIKGFITTILIEKLITPLIKNNKEKVFSFIIDLFARFKEEKNK